MLSMYILSLGINNNQLTFIKDGTFRVSDIKITPYIKLLH